MPTDRTRTPTDIDPAFDPSNRVCPASWASTCPTVAAPAGFAKMLVTPLAAVSAPPSAAARGTVVSWRIGALAAPLERSIVWAMTTAGKAARTTGTTASRGLTGFASTRGAQDHQALSQLLRAGVHHEDVHPVRQARGLGAHVPLEAVRGQGGEVPHAHSREAVERQGPRRLVVAEDHAAAPHRVLRDEKRLPGFQQRRRAQVAGDRRGGARRRVARGKSSRTRYGGHAQPERVALVQAVVQ